MLASQQQQQQQQQVGHRHCHTPGHSHHHHARPHPIATQDRSRCNKSWKRQSEPLYNTNCLIAEWYNTISNLAFVIIAAIRLVQCSQWLEQLQFDGRDSIEWIYWAYVLYFWTGVASAFHHAVCCQGSAIIDWIPIGASIVWTSMHAYDLQAVSLVTWFQVVFALLILITDHVCTPIPVPWGHVFWHILSAYAVDRLYLDIVMDHMVFNGRN